jgi:hypothetical protein
LLEHSSRSPAQRRQTPRTQFPSTITERSTSTLSWANCACLRVGFDPIAVRIIVRDVSGSRTPKRVKEAVPLPHLHPLPCSESACQTPGRWPIPQPRSRRRLHWSPLFCFLTKANWPALLRGIEFHRARGPIDKRLNYHEDLSARSAPSQEERSARSGPSQVTFRYVSVSVMLRINNYALFPTIGKAKRR